MLQSLAVEIRPLAALSENPRNARTHSDKQIAQIAASIRTFGFLTPILIDENGMVLAGHGRLAAARRIGLETVPVIPVTHLTAARKRALIIADNRLAELAGWDRALLRLELAEMTALELDFEIEITGFDTVDIDRLQDQTIQSPDPADLVPEIEDSAPPVSRLGDLWQLGRHRLTCGDALKPETYARLLDGSRAQMVFCDPPYNVPGRGRGSRPNPTLIKAVVRARSWFDDLVSGRRRSFADLAKAEGLTERYVSRLIPLAFLAPEIVEAVLAATQPAHLTAETLTRRADLPLSWAEQKAALGFDS